MATFFSKLKKLFVGQDMHMSSRAAEQIMIKDHVEKFFGAADYKLTGETDGVDVYVIPATPEKPCSTLFTVGISDNPMNVPPGMEGYEYCELMLHLPFYWIIDRKPENYWPVEWLRRVARYPRENGTWLFYGRLMPGDGPPLSSNTRLNCLTVGATRMLPNTAERDKFIMLDLGVKTVYFFTLLPLYEEEAQYRKDHTAEELFDLFDERDISDIIIPGRRSAAMYEENSKLS